MKTLKKTILWALATMTIASATTVAIVSTCSNQNQQNTSSIVKTRASSQKGLPTVVKHKNTEGGRDNPQFGIEEAITLGVGNLTAADFFNKYRNNNIELENFIFNNKDKILGGENKITSPDDIEYRSVGTFPGNSAIFRFCLKAGSYYDENGDLGKDKSQEFHIKIINFKTNPSKPIESLTAKDLDISSIGDITSDKIFWNRNTIFGQSDHNITKESDISNVAKSFDESTGTAFVSFTVKAGAWFGENGLGNTDKQFQIKITGFGTKGNAEWANNSKNNKNLALGLGLGLGIPAAIIIIIIIIVVIRRKRTYGNGIGYSRW